MLDVQRTESLNEEEEEERAVLRSLTQITPHPLYVHHQWSSVVPTTVHPIGHRVLTPTSSLHYYWHVDEHKGFGLVRPERRTKFFFSPSHISLDPDHSQTTTFFFSSFSPPSLDLPSLLVLF